MSRIVSVVNQWIKRYIFVVEIIFLSHQLKVSTHEKKILFCSHAIGAVVGLIGGVKVYSKFSSGDPDTSKTAASWFGACIFLIVAATILRSFFL